MNKTLVICRVESAHKAPVWAKTHGGYYDCLLSQYGTEIDPKHHHFIGGKWAGIYDLFTGSPELLERYEYFWLPDDDIETTPEEICKFLFIAQSEGFQLAQPALTPSSVYAYRLTVSNPRFKFRKTNFVELMLPLLHRDVLEKALPFFANRHAALGIDWMWHRLTSNPDEDIAIVDCVPMGHHRPRKTHLAMRMRQNHRIDIMKEREHTMRELDIQPLVPRAHAGCLANGRAVKASRLAFETIFGYWSIRNKIKQRRWVLDNYLEFLPLRKIRNIPDLS